MTQDELPDFTTRLLAIAEMYNEKLSESKILLYFDALMDLPLESVFQGFRKSLRYSEFFPRPAKVREHIEGTRADKAELAWVTWKEAARKHGAMASLEIDDPALAETILTVFGSWPASCALELSDEMWSSKRKEFERVFRIMESLEMIGMRRLPGIAQTQNSRPEWSKFTPIVHIGESTKPKLLQ